MVLSRGLVDVEHKIKEKLLHNKGKKRLSIRPSKTFNDQSFRVYQYLTLRGSNDVGSKESPAFVCFVAGS